MKILNTLLFFLCLPLFLNAQSATDDWTFHHNPEDGWFGNISEGPNGHIFVGGGSPQSHFREYDGNNWTLYNQSNTGAPFGFFGRDLITDSNGTLWLSPGNANGVTSWDGTNLTNFNTTNSDIISNSNFGVGIDENNTLWTTSMQSFDGTNWETYSPNGCYHGGMRLVFVDSDNAVWIYGVFGIGIETGILDQPCIFRIANGEVTAFHIDNGDNLPVLSGGYHLIGELSDGTLFVAGKTLNGIELKTFDGENWQDLDTYTGPEAGSSFWGLWVDANGNILLGGQKDATTAQIVKYCQGTWTFYDLPEADGFPKVIYDLMVDRQSRLWISGQTGLASLPYTSTTCLTTTGLDPVQNEAHACAYLRYENGYLMPLNCAQSEQITSFTIYDALGRQIGHHRWTGQSTSIGQLPTGMYAVRLEFKDHKAFSTQIIVN
ncbi:MAG: hypothetical protein DHS20C18_45100 [Saprospiraceae bacterium]|nr:MAG: hypothetical protein DHS20C18_45100 [Saprospiraceae bacterium]